MSPSKPTDTCPTSTSPKISAGFLVIALRA